MTKGFKDPCAAITPSANSGAHPIVAARPAESEFHRLDSIVSESLDREHPRRGIAKSPILEYDSSPSTRSKTHLKWIPIVHR